MSSLIQGSPTRSPCACMQSQPLGCMDDDIIMHDEDCSFQGENVCEDLRIYDEETSERQPGSMQKKLREAELEERIRALKQRNEALWKRHQEVEEDKKLAEQKDKASRSSLNKKNDLIVTIEFSSEARVVKRKLEANHPYSRGAQDPTESGDNRGVRRRLLATTNPYKDAPGSSSQGHMDHPVPKFRDLREYLLWKKDHQRNSREHATRHRHREGWSWRE